MLTNIKTVNKTEPSIKNSAQENREYIFTVWYKHGRNDTETVKAIKKDGFSVSRQTLNAWRDKYAWVERADKLDALNVTATDSSIGIEAEILQAYMEQKTRYENYFASLGDRIDTKAVNAYMTLTQKIIELAEKVAPVKKSKKKGLSELDAEKIRADILGIKNYE